MPPDGASTPTTGLTIRSVSLPSPPVTSIELTPENATAAPPLMLQEPLSVLVAVMTMTSSPLVPLMTSALIVDLRCGGPAQFAHQIQVIGAGTVRCDDLQLRVARLRRALGRGPAAPRIPVQTGKSKVRLGSPEPGSPERVDHFARPSCGQ